MIRINKGPLRGRIHQGDVFKDVEFIEYAQEEEGIIEVSKIVFPLIIVLTQDCDLEQDYRFRWSTQATKNQDKWLLSVLVAPLYNAEHVYKGEHLSELDMMMSLVPETGTSGKFLKSNQRPRYHYIEFPDDIPIVPSVIDFKHYFSANVSYLKQIRRAHFVCRVSPLFREAVSQRFASYLARIGLPDLKRR